MNLFSRLSAWWLRKFCRHQCLTIRHGVDQAEIRCFKCGTVWYGGDSTPGEFITGRCRTDWTSKYFPADAPEAWFVGTGDTA
jgi:hypothetical protein